MLRRLREFIFRLRRDRAGAVGLVAALALPAVIGVSSLVGEYGYVLLVKTENQRVADLAAYAGAIAYTTSGTNSAMTNAADAVAALNGVAASGVSATLVTSPTGDGNQAVRVSVNTNVPVYLAQVVGANTTVPVGAVSAAELNARASPCVIALSGSGQGVNLSGGTSLSTSQCTVGSNANVSVPCGTKITTLSVAYNGSVSEPCTGIVTAAGAAAPLAKKTSADPLSGASQVKAAYSGLAAVSGLIAPVPPGVPVGPNLALDWSTSTQMIGGCTESRSSSVWTVACPSGTFNFGKLTVGGGMTVNFALSAPASNTYTFSGAVTNSGGSTINFGSGTFQFNGGLDNSGSAMTLGAGAYYIGLNSQSGCGMYAVCNGGGATLTIGGPSTFVIGGGVYNSGGAKMTLGAGATNVFQVGPNPAGYAFNLGGGATTILGDATTASATPQFQVVGDIVNSGGGCTVISAATEHDIRGNISTSGGTILGSGIYYVTGYVAIGASGGGDTTCDGMSNVGVLGNNVSLVIGGASTPSGCAGDAFCIGAGYGHVTLTAPTSGPLAGLAVVGPQSNSNGTLLTAGASNTSVSGAFYFPSGSISMNGGSGLGGGSGQCLEIIGSQVTLSGGAAAASNCQSLNGSSGAASILLVQ